MNSKAFTLAEVLITLTIIGIVSAMTIPTVISRFRNKTLETQYKKSVSVIYQALLFAKQEAGIENFGEYCTYYPYNDNSHEYPNSNECYHVFYKSLIRNKSFFPSSNWTLNSDISRINEKLRTYDGKSKITRKRAWDNPVFYTNLMPDGSFMNIHILENNVFIAVDTNGKKNPNKLGHDIFIFTINKNNDSLSYINSASAGRECSNSSTSETNGYYCSYYALRDECPFDSSKKYFECLP